MQFHAFDLIIITFELLIFVKLGNSILPAVYTVKSCKYCFTYKLTLLVIDHVRHYTQKPIVLISIIIYLGNKRVDVKQIEYPI